MKKTFDVRERHGIIVRLARFDREGFVHMVSYRVMVFLAVIYGIAVFLSLLYPLAPEVFVLTVLVWIFFTPQVYETAKSFALISSRGLAFGHLSEEYKFIVKTKYKKSGSAFMLIPYLVMLVWVIGFVFLLLWWPR